jgi:O-antigen/teichoic acid export membrane protein
MISLFGAAVTIGLNIILIPEFGYVGAAWTTLAAYGGICVLSYMVGQRYYLIPYSLSRVSFYLLLGAAFYAVHAWAVSSSGLGTAVMWLLRFFLLAVFGLTAFLMETRSRAGSQQV